MGANEVKYFRELVCVNLVCKRLQARSSSD